MGAEFYGTEPSFVSLKALSFESMPKWKEWLCSKGQGRELFPHLKELYIQDFPRLIGALPSHLPLLKKLVIEGCEELVAPLPRVPVIRDLRTRSLDISEWKELPPLLQELSITNCDYLQFLLEEGKLERKTSLEDLTIRNCSFFRRLCRCCLPVTLKSFYVEGCKELDFFLPEFFKCHHPSLRYFQLCNSTCSSSFLSTPLGNFLRVHSIDLNKLEGLEFLSVSTSDGDLPSFDGLHISMCPNLVSICCKNVKVACFKTLMLLDCPELIFPIRGLPSSLTSLSIINCNKFTSHKEFGLQGLRSLTDLLTSDLLNLSSLDGMGLQLLTSLRQLQIRNCPKLQSLTKEWLPISLSLLIIRNCPLLKDRCKFWTGEDRPHIAHIQGIVIDDQVL